MFVAWASGEEQWWNSISQDQKQQEVEAATNQSASSAVNSEAKL